MSKRSAGLLIEDVRDAMRKIASYVRGMDLAAFVTDEKTVDAVVRNVSVIGEAVKQLPEDFKDSHPEIPWAQMAGMRNRIVHDYAGVDLEIIWQVITHALPDLAARISKILSSDQAD
jgi:uncharacterized protein with HEPN domain